MKKKIVSLLVLIVTVVTAFVATTLISSAEVSNTITISYMKTQDTLDSGAALDKKAYADGKQTVASGEKFKLPTTADSSYANTDGYVVVWYTENGRTYMAGEEVSFTEDTKLFRAICKKVTTVSELSSALNNNTYCAILDADIDTTGTIGTKGEQQSVIILNGHTLNISYTNSNQNNSMIGASRAGKHIYGSGTVNVDDTTNMLGKQSLFNCNSHFYNGDRNKTVIGIDVTINAPEFHLILDRDQARTSGYPRVRIYGKVNVFSLGYFYDRAWNSQSRFEICEGAEITLSANQFLYEALGTTNVNEHRFDITISGGKFNLPEEAQNVEYWTLDFLDEYVFHYFHNKSTKKYGVNTLTFVNMDVFQITGGSYNVKLPFEILKNGYQCVYNETTGYYDVELVGCTLDGSNGEHKFTISDSYEGIVSSCEGIGV